MVSSLLIRVLLLASLCILAVGKNVAPFPQKDAVHPRHPSRNKAPSVGITGSVRHGSTNGRAKRDLTVVPESHVFYNNYQANFSWYDPRLAAALGITEETTPATNLLGKRDGHGRLHKRAPGSSPGDPVFKLPSCLGCIEAQNRGTNLTLADLTMEYLERQITKPAAQLYSKCLFYTSVPRFWQNPSEWTDRRDLGGMDRHRGLSKIASDYACRSNKFTIWHMFTGANDVTGEVDNVNQRNYWEVYTAGSWLNFLVDQGQQFEYFGRMSDAMASRCGGVIYVMSMRPRRLSKYGFIWGTVEYRRLFARWSAGLAGAPSLLISIDAADPSKQYYIDWATQEPEGQVPRNSANFLRFDDDEGLEKRDTCTPNLDYERADEDWFG